MKKYFKYLFGDGKSWLGVIGFILTLLILLVCRGLKEVIENYGVWLGIAMCSFLILIIGLIINHTLKKSKK